VPTQTYDVAIAYRICPSTSRTPLIFRDDKYRLAELCLKSFRESLGSLKVKLYALLDNCPEEYENLFRRYFDDDSLELIRLGGVGNPATLMKQIEILLGQNCSELVYFAEDDYFYLPNQFREMVEFARSRDDVHFVSPYDHLDYYTRRLHQYPSRIVTFGSRHWRTTGVTNMTFLTKKQVLMEAHRVFKTYTRRNRGILIWLSLTKHKALNPIYAFPYLMHERRTFKKLARSWLSCWRHILFGRRWNLWVPMPSIATHMEKTALAPCVDWIGTIRAEVGPLQELMQETNGANGGRDAM